MRRRRQRSERQREGANVREPSVHARCMRDCCRPLLGLVGESQPQLSSRQQAIGGPSDEGIAAVPRDVSDGTDREGLATAKRPRTDVETGRTRRRVPQVSHVAKILPALFLPARRLLGPRTASGDSARSVACRERGTGHQPSGGWARWLPRKHQRPPSVGAAVWTLRQARWRTGRSCAGGIVRTTWSRAHRRS